MPVQPRLLEIFQSVMCDARMSGMLNFTPVNTHICQHVVVAHCDLLRNMARMKIVSQMTDKVERRPVFVVAVNGMSKLKKCILTHGTVLQLRQRLVGA